MDNGWDVHARLLLICDSGYPHCHDGTHTQYVWKEGWGQRGGWKGIGRKGQGGWKKERRGGEGRGRVDLSVTLTLLSY